MRETRWPYSVIVVLFLIGCSHPRVREVGDSVATEFVGSTPGDPLPIEFLGGLASDTLVHCITWKVTFLTNSNGTAASYKLGARYRVPTRSNPNQSEDGPGVDVRGKWEIITRADSPAIYRLKREAPERSLSFVKVGNHLLHLLNADGTLAIGNGGWSYTLNDAARAEKTVEPAVAMTVPDMSYRIAPLATGATVFAVFEGRTPCHGIARELKKRVHAGCTKAKWRVTLYRDAQTALPTAYKVEGTLFRQVPREGTWNITRGASISSGAIVYQLGATQTEPALLLLKGDENVLHFLNADREVLVGNGDFSYTLNRVQKK